MCLSERTQVFNCAPPRRAHPAASQGIHDEGRPRQVLSTQMKVMQTLNMKTASLYAHVKGMDGLLTEIKLNTIRQMAAAEMEAIAGKEKDMALFALAEAYRNYAKEHPGLYMLVMGGAHGDNSALEQAAEEFSSPIRTVLSQFGVSAKEQANYERVLRAMMHGFVSQEECGAFSGQGDNLNESYFLAVRIIAESLE